MVRSILVIDNKELNNVLKEALPGNDYKILFAADIKEGLNILAEEKIHLMILNMKMPGIVEFEFLREIKSKYFSLIKVISILNEDVKEDIVIRSITEGMAKSYITKPWDNSLLKKQIVSLFAMQESLNQKDLLELINKIDELPVLPLLYQKVMNLIQQNKGINEIADVIEKEPGYVAKIIGIVNSAFYGGKIGSVKQALLYLGTNTIKDVILFADIFEYFRHAKIKAYDINLLWKHFNLCNKIMQHLYYKIHGRKIFDKFASTGLLHDIGKLIMLKYFPEQFRQIWIKKNKNPDIPFTVIENDILGVSHTQLGAYLLNWWNLPSYFIEVCLYHHNPLSQQIVHRELISLIHIADIYSWKKLKKFLSVKVIPEAYQIANIDEAAVQEVVNKVDIN